MNINNEKNNIYQSIGNFFGNPYFTKAFESQKDRLNNVYSVYYAKIGCMLCIEDRYLVAIVNNDNNAIGNKDRLLNLPWISFQTRTLEKPPIQGLRTVDVKSINSSLMSEETYLTNKLNDKWIYECKKSPLTIELLLDDDTSNYSAKGTIKTCLETYMCVLNLTI